MKKKLRPVEFINRDLASDRVMHFWKDYQKFGVSDELECEIGDYFLEEIREKVLRHISDPIILSLDKNPML